MTTAEKMDALLKYLGMSPKQFAQNLGYESPQSIYDIRHGKIKSFSPKVAEAILNAFPQINSSWLLADDEDMLIDSRKRKKYVPLINLDSVGGMSRLNSTDDVSQYVERFIEFESAQDGDIAIHQSGESMLPDISSNNILVLRKLNDWKEYFGFGKLFVIELKDGRRITKRVLNSSTNPKDNVLCISFNPNFPAEELPRKNIRSVWRVLYIGMDLEN